MSTVIGPYWPLDDPLATVPQYESGHPMSDDG